MSWAIEIPCADRSDHITELPGLIRRAVSDGQLSEAQGAIAREIEQRLLLDGCRTVGDALDRLEDLSETDRRQWLDQARTAQGLPSIAVVEQRRADAKFERAFNRLQPPPPPEWSPLQRCPECGAFPMKDSGGWAEVSVERWWCPKHHEGHEDDMKPHEPAYIGVTGTGRPIPSAKEKARIEAWHREHREKEEREKQQRAEHERRQAEALDAVRERYDREAVISVLGVRCHPDGRIVSP